MSLDSHAMLDADVDKIGQITKVFVYQTASKLYLVGASDNKKSWRILKIDRLESVSFVWDDDGGIIYTREEANEVLGLVRQHGF